MSMFLIVIWLRIRILVYFYRNVTIHFLTIHSIYLLSWEDFLNTYANVSEGPFEKVLLPLSDGYLKTSLSTQGPPEAGQLLRPLSPVPHIRLGGDSPMAPHLPHPHGLAGLHVLTVDMFSKEQLNDVFNLAQTMRAYVLKDRPLDHILKVPESNNSVQNTLGHLKSPWISVGLGYRYH